MPGYSFLFLLFIHGLPARPRLVAAWTAFMYVLCFAPLLWFLLLGLKFNRFLKSKAPDEPKVKTPS